MSQIKVNAVTDGSGGNTATINSMTPTADSLQGFRNRIINGDMRIDQRNAGASVTFNASSGDVYILDRFVSNNSTDGAYTELSVNRSDGSYSPDCQSGTLSTCLTSNAYLSTSQSTFCWSVGGTGYCTGPAPGAYTCVLFSNQTGSCAYYVSTTSMSALFQGSSSPLVSYLDYMTINLFEIFLLSVIAMPFFVPPFQKLVRRWWPKA